METYRDAVARGIRALGYTVVRAEDHGASPASPQVACLADVRRCNIVVLLLGEHYGARQVSGLSATHEEFQEARDRTEVVALLQRGVNRDERQSGFVREVQDWAKGHFTEEFDDESGLQEIVTRALHRLALSKAVGQVSASDLKERAHEAVPSPHDVRDPVISLVVVGGPTQSVIRPAMLEDPELAKAIQQEAQFGATPIFTRTDGVQERVVGDALILEQGPRRISINELGDIRVDQSASPENKQWYSVVIEEELARRVELGLRYAAWLLDHVDPQQRISDVVTVVTLLNCRYHAWRKLEEHQNSQNSITMTEMPERLIVELAPSMRRRAALLHDTTALVEDIVARLRRGTKP